MSEHTKEPWITVETELDVIEITNADRNGLVVPIAKVSTGYVKQVGIEQEANARRIVACVNACAGLDTDLLENMLMLGDTLKQRFKVLTNSESELQQQRDKLLAALESAVEAVGDHWIRYGLREVIAEVKG